MPYEFIEGMPVLFIHIPKNAGSSVKKYFKMQETCHLTAQQFLSSIEWGDLPIAINREDHEETFYQKTQAGLAYLNKNRQHPFVAAFKFCFVRNPWDRLLSLYHYHQEDFGGLGTFEDFLQNLHARTGPIFGPASTTLIKLTQTEYISVDSPDNIKSLEENTYEAHRGGVRYATGPTSKIAMNYVGRYETIKDDVKQICRLLENKHKDEWEKTISTNWGDFNQHERKSANSPSHYMKLYKDFESIYSVFDYYYEDAKNFGYTFSGYPNCEITKECIKRYKELHAA